MRAFSPEVRLAAHAMDAKNDLVIGACSGDSRLVLSALRRGANPNARYRGRTVLLWAVQEGHMNVVRALVRAGASLERRDDLGFTPLGQAVGEGNLELVEFLLNAGAKVNGRTQGGSPLHTACAYRRLAMAKLLLANGANPLALAEEGRKPVDFTTTRSNKTDRELRKVLRTAASSLSGGQ